MPEKVRYYRPPGQPTKQEARRGRDQTLVKLYSTARWRKFRSYIKADRILCERCKAKGLIVVGDHVHHKIDPRDNTELAFDASNVELLCHGCHSAHHNTVRGHGMR
jgi:5-methylcytosine-specific restriction protein A